MEITFGDLKAYVQQLSPGDSVGRCWSMDNCLVACAAKWKYRNHYARVSGDNKVVEIWDPKQTVISGEIVELPEDVTQTATKFDSWPDYSRDNRGPTKSELAVYMPELMS